MQKSRKRDWTLSPVFTIFLGMGEQDALAQNPDGGHIMKTWTKPAVREQEVGLEVTSYLPAEIDVI